MDTCVADEEEKREDPLLVEYEEDEYTKAAAEKLLVAVGRGTSLDRALEKSPTLALGLLENGPNVDSREGRSLRAIDPFIHRFVTKRRLFKLKAKLPLLDVAKDEKCLAGVFLARARSHPEELAQIEVPQQEDLAASAAENRISSRVLKAKRHGKGESMVVGYDLTPVHYFLRNCCDLESTHIEELFRIDSTCFERVSSLGRSPVHWLLAFNARIKPRVLVALHHACEGCFRARDAEGWALIFLS